MTRSFIHEEVAVHTGEGLVVRASPDPRADFRRLAIGISGEREPVRRINQAYRDFNRKIIHLA